MDNNKTPLCFLFSVPCILFNQLISPSFSYTSRFPFSYTHRPSIPSSSHSYSDKSNYKISPKFPSKTHKLNLKNHFYLCHFVIVPFIDRANHFAQKIRESFLIHINILSKMQYFPRIKRIIYCRERCSKQVQYKILPCFIILLLMI